MILLNLFTIDQCTLIFAVIAGISSAIWAITSYTKSNKIKAAEIFFNIEGSFSEHIPFLIEIENNDSYIHIIETLNKDKDYKDNDIKIFQNLDSMLRHFTTCYQIKKLKIDNETIEQSYSYYLKVFLKPDRKEIREYIRKYFTIVDEWLSVFEMNTLKINPTPNANQTTCA